MTADDWRFNADFLNAKGAVLKRSGLKLAYHNHNAEFSPLAGGGQGARNGYEILLATTDPALVGFEMDAGWVAAAGQDPFALLKDHPGRFTAMHVRDIKATTKPNFVFVQDPTEVGSGKIDWKRLLPAAHAAGVRDFFVEQELLLRPFAPGIRSGSASTICRSCGPERRRETDSDVRKMVGAQTARFGPRWCHDRDSNPGPQPTQGCALPLSYRGEEEGV